MKQKLFLSTLALFLFAFLGGGSFSEGELETSFVVFIVAVVLILIAAFISGIVKDNNKKKRLQMIREDEDASNEFDRSVYIGDDRCKIYFDNKKKQVMIMRVMTSGIKKEYVDDFEFPGKELAIYTSPAFNVYDPNKRKLLSGTYNDMNIIHQITSIAEIDNNKDAVINSKIKPKIEILRTSHTSTTATITNKLYSILIEESRGLIAVSESGKVIDVFNYIDANNLPQKRGDNSTISTKIVGNYLFIMDDFFKVLVLVGHSSREILNYSDIIEVSYEENGTQLFTKSAGRTVGGAIVGGVLMGGAGAVVGGLSGASKQNKEVNTMDIKILLRSTSRTSCVLHFKDDDRVLKTKGELDRKQYENYLNNANQAKDLLSVIIDNAKQIVAPIAQPVVQQTSSSSSSVADELAKLAKLKADGILTDEEFQIQKAKLLD